MSSTAKFGSFTSMPPVVEPNPARAMHDVTGPCAEALAQITGHFEAGRAARNAGHLVVVHGPPGCGRTTVAQAWLDARMRGEESDDGGEGDRDEPGATWRTGWLEAGAQVKVEQVIFALREFVVRHREAGEAFAVVIEGVEATWLELLRREVARQSAGGVQLEVLATAGVAPQLRGVAAVRIEAWPEEALVESLEASLHTEAVDRAACERLVRGPLRRAGLLPAMIEPLRRALSFCSVEELVAWSRLGAFEFDAHPLSGLLTRAADWEPVWERASEATRDAWAVLATFVGPFDLTTALTLLDGASGGFAAVEALLELHVLQPREYGGNGRLVMWPGARLFAATQRRPVAERARRMHARLCVVQARALHDALECSFLDAEDRTKIGQWRAELEFGLRQLSLPEPDADGAAAAASDPERKVAELTVATVVSLLYFDEREHQAGIDLLKARVPADEALDDASAELLEACCAALRVLAKTLATAGILENAQRYVDRALAIAHRLDDPKAISRACYEHACIVRAAGDAAAARAAIEAGVAAATRGELLDDLARTTTLEALVVHTFEGHQVAEPKYRRALTLARQARVPALEAYILVHLGNVYWREGDLVRAWASMCKAESWQARLEEHRYRGTTLNGLASIALDMGCIEEADRFAAKAGELHRAADNALPDGLTSLLRSRICVDAGDVSGGERFFVEALASLPLETSVLWRQKVEVTEALVALMRQDFRRADGVAAASLARGQLRAEMLVDMLFVRLLCATSRREADAVAHFAGLLTQADVDAAPQCKATVALLPVVELIIGAGADDAALEELDADTVARACRAFATAFGAEASAIHVRNSSRLRGWIRLLDTLLPASVRAQMWKDALNVGQAHWVVEGTRVYSLDSQAWIDLGRRPVPARIFDVLVEARLEGVAELTDERLIQAGWPGEVLLAAAATSRLHKAISDLRKLGPGAIIERTALGYGISPEIAICRVPESFSRWWSAVRPVEPPGLGMADT